MYVLYKEKCTEDRRKAAGSSVYSEVFCGNFFISPTEKYKCQPYTRYYQAEEKGQVTDDLKKKHEVHLQRIVRAREENDIDNKNVSSKDNYNTATFDLKAVLPVRAQMLATVTAREAVTTCHCIR